MKKLATVFIGLSLFVGSFLFAQDKFAAFYPAEDNDSVSYGFEGSELDTSGIALSLDSTTRGVKNDMTFSAFYPAEDDDSVNYGFEGGLDGSDMALSLDSRSRSATIDTSFDAFYPMEDDDSARY